MTREALVSVPPEDVLALAKSFFTGAHSGYAAAIVDEGPDYVRFQTFRGVLAVSARREDELTRVRCSTLRYHPSIGQFLLHLETGSVAPQA